MRILLLSALALLPSCSLFKKDEEKPKEQPAKSSLVGRVASMPAGHDFVLIESYGSWDVPDGGLLSGIGTEGRTSNLVATGEKMGQYAAADIRSGVAKIGDPVYYRPIAEPKETTAIANPAVPGAKTKELETQKDSLKSPAKP